VVWTALSRLKDLTLSRYILVSAGALAVDMGAFLQFVALGLDPTLSATVAYCIGIAAHWIMSSRFVFALRVHREKRKRNRQKVQFILSALVGLALTAAIVEIGIMVGSDPRAAKVLAVAVSFIVTWIIRNKLVFREDQSTSGVVR
jgi:putative flippase GtrA